MPGEVPAELTITKATTGTVYQLAFRARLARPVLPLPRATPTSTQSVDAREYQATNPGDDEELALAVHRRRHARPLSVGARRARARAARQDPARARLRRPLPGLRQGPERRAAHARRARRRPALGGARRAPRAQLVCASESIVRHVGVAVAGCRVLRERLLDPREILGRRARRRSAPAFSSRYVRRFVPGIGTTSSPRDSTHASASCAGRAALLRPRSPARARRGRGCAAKFSPWKRGWYLRKSPSSKSSGDRNAPGQEAAAERRVRDEADAELAHGLEHLVVLRLARPERVLRSAAP